MTKLPRVSGQTCVSALLKFGFEFKRQHGSHIILRRESPFAQVVIPDHSELDTFAPCCRFLSGRSISESSRLLLVLWSAPQLAMSHIPGIGRSPVLRRKPSASIRQRLARAAGPQPLPAHTAR